MIDTVNTLHSKKCLDVMHGGVEENRYGPFSIVRMNENLC